MSHTNWEVSKYDLNDLEIDHLLYVLHKMEWEDIFTLIEINEAFYKMMYKMRTRNMMFSSQLNERWKIIERFPYLENVTILEDYPEKFREELKQMKNIKKLRIDNDGVMINYIMSKVLEEIEIIIPYLVIKINEDTNVDYLIDILKNNTGINRLMYTEGYMSNESIYYMMRNNIRILNLVNVQVERSSTFGKYLQSNTCLRDLTIMGLDSEETQNIAFTNEMTNNVKYKFIRNYQKLKEITLYFNYGSNAESNVLDILKAIKNAEYLKRIRIYRIKKECDATDHEYTEYAFHDEITTYIQLFENKNVDICTASCG